MSIGLLDVNVLIALFDPAHPQHDAAHNWFSGNQRHGWATSNITVAGCVRILSNPAYPTVEATPPEVISRLDVMVRSPYHRFWADSINFLDPAVIRPEYISSHKQITDTCLLALACANGGKLVTLDRAISLTAVVGAQPPNLELIRE